MRVATSVLTASMISFIASSCGPKTQVLTDPNDPTNVVTVFKDDDPKMNAAYLKARNTAGQMIDGLESPQGKSQFAVKMLFRDKDDEDFGEQMWVQPVQYAGGKFTGRLSNDPQFVTSVRRGQVVSVRRDEIMDWMYVEDGKLVGGYTIRVQRDSLDMNERAEFDQSVGYRIE